MSYRTQARGRRGSSKTVQYASFVSELSDLEGTRKNTALGRAEQCLSAFQKTKQQLLSPN